ncbi:uncharacterized protein LOC121671475 [Corvus kubaryi]|uniref:uncharacterized protein LOC121671475 n=1 Tax=Corvus kubaryi TaxID=68294 RepID=UPI001C0584C3|nr:uncharacterized protein LOC121671475 [Corvus kubaryi]
MEREEYKREEKGQRRTHSSAELNISAPDTCGGPVVCPVCTCPALLWCFPEVARHCDNPVLCYFPNGTDAACTQPTPTAVSPAVPSAASPSWPTPHPGSPPLGSSAQLLTRAAQAHSCSQHTRSMCWHGGFSDVKIYFPLQLHYEANLPNFVTSYPRDLFNLKLKPRHLNRGESFTTGTFIVLENWLLFLDPSRLTISIAFQILESRQFFLLLINTVCLIFSDPRLEPLKGKQKDPDRRFLTYKPHESKWDPQLPLPRSPQPPKSASFTVSRTKRQLLTFLCIKIF